MTHQAEFVIVGGGTAGCVLADRLSASGRHEVLLLEAGGADRSPWIHIPLGYGKLFDHPAYDWRFKTVPQAQLNGRQIAVPRGRVLGGSSSTNGLLYVRGQREDFDAWEAAGNPGWGYEDVLPYFRRSEDQQHGADAWHGSGGPLCVRDPVEPHELAEAFITAAAEQGIPRNDDFNGSAQEGAGYYQMNTRGVRRCSTAAGFLRRARGRPNLRVIIGAQVDRIEFCDGAAEAVHFQHRGGSSSARAAREIILAAGAIASPQILMLSGVGFASDLERFGIRPVADRPQVGQGLQDHLNIRTSYRCARPITMNDRLGTFAGRMLSGAEYLLRGKGPLTIAAGYAGAFYRSAPRQDRPDMQAILLLFSTDSMGTRLLPDSGFMASAYQLRPSSRGAVTLASPDPRAAPRIDPAYLTDEQDRHVTLRGMKRLQAIMASPALRPYLAGPGDPPLGSDNETLMAHIRAHGSAGHHFVGSCRMGADPNAVVDPRLRVNGVRRLRVVDGSIMPSITSGNTLAPIVMIAEKGSDMILEDARERMAA